jgi:predicted nucleotidyltransferase
VRALAQKLAHTHPELRRFGYFGSYARGDWGVGSDVDLVAIVARSDRAFIDRPLDYDLGRLPVPADLLVYTLDEWQALLQSGAPFVRRLAAETVWAFTREGDARA